MSGLRIASSLAIALASCGVDADGLLEGKQCNAASECVSGYICDLESNTCVSEGLDTTAGAGHGANADDEPTSPVEQPMSPSGDEPLTEAPADDSPTPDTMMLTPPPIADDVCGNGKLESGEVCDHAGNSAACDLACEERQVPAQCSYATALNTLYLACNDAQPVMDAMAACRGVGGRLIEIENLQEHNAVWLLAQEAGLGDYVIAATDAEQEGNWIWAGSNTPLWQGNWQGEPVGNAFASWMFEEPNDHVGATYVGEDCAQANSYHPNWNDVPCHFPAAFICEFPSAIAADCGNGELDAGEACDTSGETEYCDSDCTVPRCGDGRVNQAAGEFCDDGNDIDDDTCNNECTGVPSSPTLSIQVSEQQVTLNWTPTFDTGLEITSYQMQYRTTAGGDGTTIEVEGTTGQFQNIPPGEVSFWVRAQNSQGLGPPSNLLTRLIE